MELKDVLLKRRSIRKFKNTPISDEIIKELLDAAMSGPSACNRQPWDFYVIKSKEKIKELSKASFFTKYESPLAIVVCGYAPRFLPSQLAPYWTQDCGAATQNILLRATDLGLGAVWCGLHPQKRPEQRVRKFLDASERTIPMALIFIGYPDENPEPRTQYDSKKVHFIE